MIRSSSGEAVRFEITASARGDYTKLSPGEQAMFRDAVTDFNRAADRFVATRDPTVWPKRLRVRAVRKAPGVFEMTWSFAGPDGRATWEWATASDDEGTTYPVVMWRRIGGHQVFSDP